ncbi:MAG: hypothetical protein HY000_02810 [Planctomycetes bacterium]|nr:hypothetical protein [Planctomycetota bacterium]
MMAAILCAAILPTVGVLRAQEWKVTFEEPANKLALLPDERLIAVALGRGTGLLQEPRPCDVVLLDMASGAERQVLKGNLDGVRTVAYSRRHRLLASGGYDGHVRLWDISKGELIADISPEVGSILAMTFAPNERSLVMSGWRGNQDEIADSLLIWDVIEQRQDKKREMKLNAVIDLAVAPDGLHLASCSLDGTVAIWTLPTLDPAKVLLRAVASVSSISFSPDGAVLAVAHDPRPFNPAQGSVELWDAKTWQKVSTIAFSGPVATVRFSLDGNYLVAGGGGVRKLELWDRKAAKLAGSVAADDADVSDICVLPAGRSLIVAQKDGSVERWRFAHIRNGN